MEEFRARICEMMIRHCGVCTVESAVNHLGRSLHVMTVFYRLFSPTTGYHNILSKKILQSDSAASSM